MATVEDRWRTEDKDTKEVVRRARDGVGLRYRVRYRDPSGAQRHKSFAKKGDADRFAVTVEADKLRGTYFDPEAGRMTLRAYAEQWFEAQTSNPSTLEAMALRLRKHIYPVLGDKPLVQIKPSVVQAWLRGLQNQQLSARYIKVIFANLSSVLSAAVDDERIAKNPCKSGSVKLPSVEKKKVVPLTVAQVKAIERQLPHRFALMAILGAGLGLRQGEIFGLAVDDIDFLRGVVHIRRQVKIVGCRQVYDKPKNDKVREVPLPESVKLVIAAHLEQWPAQSVELPLRTPDGRLDAHRLLLSTRERTALQRNYVNLKVWKPAVKAAGLPIARPDGNGMHALRHFYASVLLDGGESIRALAEYLGHTDPGFTLRTYTHLLPNSEERTKKAVDRALLGGTKTVDGHASHVEGVL